MSIQFTCVSCHQAIEIDDQWAMRLVECPYCHDTVRSPGMSTLPPNDPPVASPVSGAAATPVSTAVVSEYEPVAAMKPAGSRNTLAIVSIVLASVAIMLLLGLSTFMYMKLIEPLGVENPTQEQVMQAMKTATDEQQPWIMQLAIVSMAFIGLWLASIVCSVIAVTRRARRPLAIVALVISLLPFLLILTGL